jgi:hypothetical protein
MMKILSIAIPLIFYEDRALIDVPAQTWALYYWGVKGCKYRKI